ncbi:MAG: hypothetical protein AAFZ80_00905 [Cyanobacteria bacterium P01_A01_bin.105]
MRWVQRWGRGLGLLCLLLGLWSCGVSEEQPPQTVVERAIALRMAHVQQQLITHLAPSTPQTPNFKLRQVIVTHRHLLETLGDTYQVNGTYEAIIQLPSRQATEAGPFEVYIQTEIDRETDPVTTRWYLAEPGTESSDEPSWQRTALKP